MNPRPPRRHFTRLAGRVLALGVLTALALALGVRTCAKAPGAEAPLRAAAPSSSALATASSAEAPPNSAGASSAEASPNSAEGSYFAHFGWGSGPGELGRDRPSEANAEGPMSFALLPDGGMLILDQVNDRLQFVGKDGKPGRSVRTGLLAPQDVAVGKDGAIAVADRLADRKIALFDAHGNPSGSLPLEGQKLREGGGMTGLFFDGAAVYAEAAHGVLHRLGSTDGTPDPEQTTLMGRPSRDGTLLLSAGITRAAEGRSWLSAIDRANGAQRFTVTLHERWPLQSLEMLDSDRHGTIYLAQLTEHASGDERLVLYCLSPRDGHLLGRVELLRSELPEETFRDFAVRDDGLIFHAELSEQGVSYRTLRCPQ